MRHTQDRPAPAISAGELRLHLGPLSLLIEEGETRQVSFEDAEVLRGVYGAVRDSHWRTLPPVVEQIGLSQSDRKFSAEFVHVHQGGGIHFAWQGTIAAKADRRRLWQVQWTMNGKSLSSFAKNRIGLCVHHPIAGFAGKPCTVVQTDGKVIETCFPSHIEPRPIFRDVRSISCELRKGVWMALKFRGDTFETEDQRNWTDASFKTYSTPLRLPVPVQVLPGDRVRQSIRLTLRVAQSERIRSFGPRSAHTDPVEIRASRETPIALPSVGMAVSPSAKPASLEEQALLKAMRLSHLRVELDLGAKSWKGDLAQAAELARALSTSLEVALASPVTEQRVDELLGQLSGSAVAVARILSDSSEPSVPLDRLSNTLGTRLFAGTMGNYAELNRARLGREVAHGVCFSLNPQVHSFDSRAVMQNLSAQREAVEDVRNWWPHAPVAVSPVTLLPRTPTGGPLRPFSGDAAPFGFDHRQSRPFGAAWTMGSLCSLVKARTESVTYFETTGPIGVIGPDIRAYPLRVGDSVRVPLLYHVFTDFGEFTGGQAQFPCISDAEAIACVMLRGAAGSALLLANLSSSQRSVIIHSDVFPRKDQLAHLRVLDRSSEEFAATQPFEFRRDEREELDFSHCPVQVCLQPYAYARVHAEGRHDSI